MGLQGGKLSVLVLVSLQKARQRKQDLQAVCPEANTAKEESKRKESDAFEGTTTNYDVPSRGHVLRIVLSGEVFDWLEFYQTRGWTRNHGGQWLHFATSLAKPGVCSVPSAL